MKISVRSISRMYFWRGMITRLWELSPKVDRLSKLKTASMWELLDGELKHFAETAAPC